MYMLQMKSLYCYIPDNIQNINSYTIRMDFGQTCKQLFFFFFNFQFKHR